MDDHVQQTAADVEDVRAGRAADLAAGAASMARGLAREETERAVKVAEQRARQEQRIESRLDGHDNQLRDLHGSIDRSAVSLKALADSLQEFIARQVKRDTEADTREALRQKDEGKQFSRWQLYSAFAAVLAMVGVPVIIAIVNAVS